MPPDKKTGRDSLCTASQERIVKMAGMRQTFQNSLELQRFVLHGVRPTGRQLGVDSYGSVEELKMNGLVCAGKWIHEALLEQGNAGVADIVTSKSPVDIIR